MNNTSLILQSASLDHQYSVKYEIWGVHVDHSSSLIEYVFNSKYVNLANQSLLAVLSLGWIIL